MRSQSTACSDDAAPATLCHATACGRHACKSLRPTAFQTCSEGEEDDISEDLDAAMQSLQALTTAKASSTHILHTGWGGCMRCAANACWSVSKPSHAQTNRAGSLHQRRRAQVDGGSGARHSDAAARGDRRLHPVSIRWLERWTRQAQRRRRCRAEEQARGQNRTSQTAPTTTTSNRPPRRRSNFCAKAGLSRTAEAFEAEWYELKATGRLGGLATSMPDVYLRNGVRGAAAGCGRAESALLFASGFVMCLTGIKVCS